LAIINHIDCTLRDGGYYNNWDFSLDLANDYLQAMSAIGVDYVELGLRTFDIAKIYKGPFAYTSDLLIRTLRVPKEIKIGVMVNASDIVNHPLGAQKSVKLLFDNKENSPVTLVRFACHLHEFETTLEACSWLKSIGYTVGINLMQAYGVPSEDLYKLAKAASLDAVDVLYFADSLGSMSQENCVQMISILREHWKGDLGIHTHNNMGKALQNTMAALDAGVSWVDSTVTGMGRGAGNAQTELLAIELEPKRRKSINIVPLLNLINRYFTHLKNKYSWGMNAYYYYAGIYGIHPSYIQEMLGDSRYDSDDLISVIQYLKEKGGEKFKKENLNNARNFFYHDSPRGNWNPSTKISSNEILILGAGPSVKNHKIALENYILKAKPIVLALNTHSYIDSTLLDYRIACHPIRLLSDCKLYCEFSQPLITPLSMLPDQIRLALSNTKVMDFGLEISENEFLFEKFFCKIPSPLVIAYALAVATSGGARRILLAGFDGYGAEDPRTKEMECLFSLYISHPASLEIFSITPTKYNIPISSVYGLGDIF
jgi:4-hydroxy 2-oxovalerate aldolase